MQEHKLYFPRTAAAKQYSRPIGRYRKSYIRADTHDVVAGLEGFCPAGWYGAGSRHRMRP